MITFLFTFLTFVLTAVRSFLAKDRPEGPVPFLSEGKKADIWRYPYSRLTLL